MFEGIKSVWIYYTDNYIGETSFYSKTWHSKCQNAEGCYGGAGSPLKGA